MKNWDEVKTFLKVAQLGTVTAASRELNIHRATVIRHIDSLEKELSDKLFLRHPQGYTLTEVGQALKKVAENSERNLNEFYQQQASKKGLVEGELIVTSFDVITSDIMPIVSLFRQRHPEIKIKLESDRRNYKLEYGEAHIAIRPGKKPTQPDYIVQPAFQHKVGLFANLKYIEQYGKPTSVEDFDKHSFVFIDRNSPRTIFEQWFIKYVPKTSIKVWVKTPEDGQKAIKSGAGIGFCPTNQDTSNEDLQEVWPRNENWSVDVWLVTHVDQHRTPKVQAFTKLLKSYFANNN